MVNRRTLKRLEEEIQNPGAVIKLRDGRKEFFSEGAALSLYALEFDEAKAAYDGTEVSEPDTPDREEARTLREALKNATSESYEEYVTRNAGFVGIVDQLKKSGA